MSGAGSQGSTTAAIIQGASQLASTLSVVVGVVISVWSFNDTRLKENQTRLKEAEAAKIEALRPFIDLQRALYKDAVVQAAVLANPQTHTPNELAKARKRFEELYVVELSMVESPEVEAKMVALAQALDFPLTKFTPAQKAAYELSHAIRDGFARDYGLDKSVDALPASSDPGPAALDAGISQPR
jgi:hypothetical protein